MSEDRVNREGLNFRFGWAEALRFFAYRLSVEALRAKKRDLPGMEIASRLAEEMRASMLAKMRGAARESEK